MSFIKILPILVWLVVGGLFLLPSSICAQGGVSTIRDDEIEKYLRQLADPVFEAAGLVPQNINIYLINSPELNAYVAGGQNLFIHTSLILESDDPNMLVGVIAHESGHIAGGHITRKIDDARTAGIQATLGYILGAASVASGAPAGATMAIIQGGQEIATRGFLKHSRAHEEAADQAGLRFLQKTGFSPNGLVTLLETLNTQQTQFHDNVNPYLLTHPLSRERIAHIRNVIETSPELDVPTPQNLKDTHLRIKAKLQAFLATPKETLEKYFDENNNVSARYARAIAFYRIPELNNAIKEIDGLIKEYPKDPYFHELRGQMMFENGRIKESVLSYQQAVDLLPKSTLFNLELGVAQLATEDAAFYKQAIHHLEQTIIKEPDNVFAWRQLGIAYGKDEQFGLSFLSLAEAAVLLDKKDNAKDYLDRARKYLPENSPAALRAKELAEMVEKNK